MNLAEYVACFLIDRNVRHVFGFQGGAVMKLIEAMVATGRIEYVQNYHEQASAFGADAYARVTGGLGVALATSGPGATNLITGIANAQFDSIPTLFITGQDYTANVTRDSGARQNGFQDLDIVSIVRPITKYAALVTDETRIRHELEKAYWFATSSRPGAVLLDIPIDVQFKDIDVQALDGFAGSGESAPTFDTTAVVARLAQAKRPVIVIGGGVRVAGGADEVRAFAAATDIPVVCTVNGLDVVEDNYGFAGLHGNTAANLATQNADLLLAFGVRFGQRHVGKVPASYTRATVVHVDIDRNELGRIFPDEIAIEADLKAYLPALQAALRGVRLADFRTWHETLRYWVAKYRANAYLNPDGVDPVRAVEAMLPFLSDQAILTSDVGQNQMWVAQAFRVRGRQRLLNSCGLGSMGYSLPAAIGARIACPGRQVVAFTGDGGLQMNLQELLLVGQRRLPIKCVVFNNNTLGMMREVQRRYYHGHYHGANVQEFVCADLAKLADTFGLGYRRVEALADIGGLQAVFADDRPYLIDLAIAFDSLLSNRYDEAPFFEAERLDD
jgi:acetolactate synthase I/II/III large subunit